MHRAGIRDTSTASANRPYVPYAVALLLVVCFLASIAGFYQTDNGFTEIIGFAGGHEHEVPAMSGVPHAHIRGGYDGQFYAQLALVPLLEDPAIDSALDNAPYRARRILFSWTAYALGLGRPFWVLQAYALQNVACWLLLAWVLTRWIPPNTPRRLALWAACLFAQGLLVSVRLALTDGPSMLLLALTVAIAERNRLWSTAAIVGVSGLGRETNLFALTVLPVPRSKAQWLKVGAAIIIAIVPLLLWQDYLFSIYRRHAFANQNQLAMPLVGYFRKWDTIVAGFARDGLLSPHMLTFLTTLGLTTQAVYIVAMLRRLHQELWWRLAIPYVALMCVLDFAVWGGHPGAAPRVLLPITFAFNVLLDRDGSRWFWVWYALGNCGLLYAADMLGW